MAKIARLFKKNDKIAKERFFGDYILGATLGVGGYAKVKLGIHKETGAKVALKILLADKSGKISESKKKQTDRAIDLLSKVNHGNVLKLLSYDKSGQYPEADGSHTPCMVMALEHAGNGELFDYLMFTGCFDEIIARSYFHQLIDGLEAIHKLGFAHRDLKPENLLLDETYTLKIADFGFATTFRTEDNKELKMKTACGTKGYLAPEVLKGKKYLQSVDIFAAGIILFITYAGFPPFNDAIPTDWWWNRLESGWKERNGGKLLDKKKEWSKHGLFWAAHERTRKFPQDLKDFILRMLHPDPNERPSIPQIREESWNFYKFPAKLFGSKEKVPRESSQRQSWYQKDTKATHELGRYLEKRRATVRKERAKKVKEQQKGMSTEQEKKWRRGSNDEEKFDPEKEDLYTFNLRMKYKETVKEIDPKGEFEQFIEEFSDGFFASTPFYFFTKVPPALVAVCFQQAAAVNNDAKVEIDPRNCRTVIRSATKSELPLEAEFEVKQYRFDDRYLVSCKRLRGDPLAYKKIINSYWDNQLIMGIMDVETDLDQDNN